MSRRDTLILRGTSLWTFFIWGVFVRNLLGDDSRGAGFKAVHLTLAVVSVALAVAIWRVATRNGRRARERAGTPS
jgi:hypothetical protein